MLLTSQDSTLAFILETIICPTIYSVSIKVLFLRGRLPRLDAAVVISFSAFVIDVLV